MSEQERMGWNHVSGWIALGVFCAAMYGGLAFLLENEAGVRRPL